MTERQHSDEAPLTDAPPALPPQPPSYDSHQLDSGVIIRDFEPHSCVARRVREPDADSQLPSYATAAASSRPWGEYGSEEAYLDALRKFVKDKDYVDGGKDRNGNSVGLIGFYGSKTAAEIAAGPGLRDDKRKSQAKKQGQGSQTNGGRGIEGGAHILTENYNGDRTGLQKWLQKKREKSSSK